jgi:hypothetical protein
MSHQTSCTRSYGQAWRTLAIILSDKLTYGIKCAIKSKQSHWIHARRRDGLDGVRHILQRAFTLTIAQIFTQGTVLRHNTWYGGSVAKLTFVSSIYISFFCSQHRWFVSINQPIINRTKIGTYFSDPCSELQCHLQCTDPYSPTACRKDSVVHN